MSGKIPYLKHDYKYDHILPFKEWKPFDNAQGCTPVDGVQLCMEKSPPLLPGEQVKAPLPTAPKPSAPPPGKKELTAPVPAMKATAEKAPKEEKKKQIKPFDLYDIPQAMRAEVFTVGAKLSQRWLDGRAYSAYVKNAKGQDVEGRYDADMIDTDTVKLSWLRKLPAIEERYQTLLKTLQSPKAIETLKDDFRKNLLHDHRLFAGPFDALTHCKNDYQTLHDQFQFQFSNVSMFDTVIEFQSWDAASRYGRNLGMSDVTASLANFTFYATVARAHVNYEQFNRYNTPKGTMHCVHSRISVTHIYIYARDSYSFYDKGKASQYLGHWNKTGLIVLPDAALVSWGMKKVMDDEERIQGGTWDRPIELENGTMPPFPVDVIGKLLDQDVYYPIRNRDYREWRERKGRGGDFLIYSDLQLVRLNRPIELDMGVVCG
ncbi:MULTISPECIES: DUF6402 family protein [unclassified Herbaspirillum]|uniref:DUF6402 family protein n=1 Tax=unclassified Herbaspirillum TaxID=2624150 RepID=UPI000E2E6E6E|nr:MULTISPECIES: DUF6402 family protein [unclassified Herbaspirillum]RFB67363.1 hypothetical protein DZB54_19510 [Herbaspirillum sp. 3R-3a1]TFI04971.1 hypothetical protein E4P32_22455 [Herbaspirillum sp. 3R11]TFI12699.1 hypothetical protein E4P31_21910 [Herbaspirillum sp. 3R-11]TFI19973.1 hypothetical protein E4P30_23070 [Herbaspirillum sp. 3C11]